jgi:hypothetical protein
MKRKINGKKVKIIGIVILVLLILIAALLLFIKLKVDNSPKSLTEKYMESYQNLDSTVLDKISYPFSDELSKTQKKKYIEVLKRQYGKMSFEIVDEDITDDDAIINVEFTVYDLAAAYDKATNYIEVYSTKFYENGAFSTTKAVDYKLASLNNCTDKVTYSVKFYYYKENGKWKMTDLSDSDIKKLDGTY